MLKTKLAQESFYGCYLYDKIVSPDHLLRKIKQVVDFSFVNDLVKDRYTPNFGRPAEGRNSWSDCSCINISMVIWTGRSLITSAST